jgi:hypothetical protein
MVVLGGGFFGGLSTARACWPECLERAQAKAAKAG